MFIFSNYPVLPSLRVINKIIIISHSDNSCFFEDAVSHRLALLSLGVKRMLQLLCLI